MFVLLLTVVLVVVDQITKQVVRLSYCVGDPHPVVEGFFNLTYVRNTGAAWGMFSGQNIVLSALSVVMLALVVIFRRSFLSDTWEHRIALGLMVSGTVGNLMDRVRLGWVTDFFDVYWRQYHWPVFNVADMCICVGVGLYILSSLWNGGHPLREGPARGESRTPEAGPNA